MLTLSSGEMAGVGSPQVQKLQVALKGLAQVAGKPIIDPGNADGIVGPKTINAVVASMSLLTAHMGAAGGIISAGLAIYGIADPSRAENLIMQYASQLEQAARAATLAISQGQQSPATVPDPGTVPMLPTATPWFKTWWGMGAIAVGAVGVLAFIFAPNARRTEAKAA